MRFIPLTYITLFIVQSLITNLRDNMLKFLCSDGTGENRCQNRNIINNSYRYEN